MLDSHCILITSDIHGQEDGLEYLHQARSTFYPEIILSAGDQCPGFSIDPLLRAMVMVRGNCDRFYEYQDLPFPPLFREGTFFGRHLVMTHSDRLWMDDFSLKEGDIFVYGHTHVPDLREEKGIYIVNPGSPSRPRSSSGPTIALYFPDRLELRTLPDMQILSSLTFSSLK